MFGEQILSDKYYIDIIIMIEQGMSYQEKGHQVLKNIAFALNNFNNQQTFTQHLTKIHQVLTRYKQPLPDHINSLIFDALKPISREITSSNLREESQVKLMESIILQIINMKYHSMSCLQNLKELLSRECFLFTKMSNAFNQSEMCVSNPEMEYYWTDSQYKTTSFYRVCCENILVGLDGIHQQFSNMTFTEINEYLSILQSISTIIKEDKLLSISQLIIQSITDIFNTSKDSLKDINKDLIDSLVQNLSKIIQYFMDSRIKKKVQLIGPNFGLMLFQQQKIQRKISGVKLLSKYSTYFYINPMSYLNDAQYCSWMEQNLIFQQIYNPQAQLWFLKLTDDIFVCYIRNRRISRDRFDRLFLTMDVSPDIRKYLYRLLDKTYLKLEFTEMEIIIGKLKNLRKYDYYDEQFFTFMDDFVKYQTYSQNTQNFTIIQAIVQQFYDQWPAIVKNKSLNTYVRLHNNIVDRATTNDDKLKEFCKTADNFYGNPTPLNMVILKRVIEANPESSSLTKWRICRAIIERSQFFKKIVNFSQQTFQNLNINDLFDLAKLLLKHYKEDDYELVNYIQLLKVAKYSKIFCQLVHYTRVREQFLMSLYDEFNRVELEFSCIKEVYYSLNKFIIHKIQHYGVQQEYEVIDDPNQIIHLQQLFSFFENTQSSKLKRESAIFISQLFTCFSEGFLARGEKIQIQFMKQLISRTFQGYSIYKNDKKGEVNLLKSFLILIEQFMGYSEILSVGILKSHNSLVATSTILIKINNEVTEGDDVLRSFEKKFPSNLTLFQVLTDVSRLFKCSPTEIMLRKASGELIPIKYNGFTLDEININGVLLIAFPSFRNRLKTYNLLEKGVLTERSLQAFKNIYNTFSKNGRMGKKQFASYVEGVTQLPCAEFDPRVNTFFQEHDKDNDLNITMEDFIKFYEQSCINKPQVVEKNLKVLHYRKDLKKYDDLIDDFNPQTTLRYHLCQNNTIYEILFQLVREQSNDSQLKDTSIRLLNRLPTYPKIINSLEMSLEALGRNQFETQYILISIQSKLNLANKSRYQTLNELLDKKRYNLIFVFLQNLLNKSQLQQQNKKCIALALHILRSLIFVPNLNKDLKTADINLELMIELPETQIFAEMIRESLNSVDIEIYQLLMVLLLTQKNVQLKFLDSGIFNQDKDIRRITCNFLLIYLKLNNYQLDLFKIEEKDQCEEWFQLLIKVIEVNRKLNLQQLFEEKLAKTLTYCEKISDSTHNKIMHGNLKILRTIILITQKQMFIPSEFCQKMMQLCSNTISPTNRILIYDLISVVSIQKCISFLHNLILTTTPTKEIQKREKYVGLKNLGSTCYMNSILQQFYFIPKLKNLVLQLKGKQVQPTQVNGNLVIDDFLVQLKKMYTHLKLTDKKYYDALQFCLTIKVDGKPINTAIQQDAHEFLNKVFNNLESYLKGQGKEKQLDEIFGGTTVTVIRCQTCKNENKKEQNFSYLLVEVKDMSSLNQSLSKLTVQQQINDYRCEVCKSKVPLVTKQSLFSKLPHTLIINLQRIVFDIETFQNIKVASRHEFPEELSMRDYLLKDQIDQNTEYELTGVVIHSGTSQSGHYYSLIKLQNQWYKFNDQTVTKFDYKNMAKESFGGMETADQWEDLKFSTNAYILYYTQKNNIVQIYQEIECHPYDQQVLEQNLLFYKQIQVHQPSLFQFSNTLFERVKPPNIDEAMKVFTHQLNSNELQHYNIYCQLLDLYLQLMKLMIVFYDFNQTLIMQIGYNIYTLLYLLPQKTQPFLISLNTQQYLDILITHNDSLVRQLYKTVIFRSYYVYRSFYSFTWKPFEQLAVNERSEIYKKLCQIFDCFKNMILSSKLAKNIFKSHNFFDCLKIILMIGEDMLSYALKENILENLLNLMLGPESTFIKSEEKRPEMPSPQSLPVLQMIIFLQSRKTGLNNIKPYSLHNLHPLTQVEQKILGDVRFFKKMIKDKHDQGILSPLITSLSYENYQFSLRIIETYIIGLSMTQSYESVLPILSHIKFILLLEDSLTNQRIKWLLGIPQYQSATKLEYAVRDVLCQSIIYVSNAFFIQSQMYEPLLQRLYEKKYRFDSLTISAIISFLQVVSASRNVCQYVMNLPPPNYNLTSYIDWIENYTVKLEREDHFGLGKMEKEQAVTKLQKFIANINQKYPEKPLKLKQIVGRNANVSPRGAIKNQYYNITVWQHQTYVIPNLPTGTSNLSVSDGFERSDLAKYIFSDRSEHIDKTTQLETDITILTWEVQTKYRLKLKFNGQLFNHQIDVNQGHIEINMPFDSRPIHQIATIEILEQMGTHQVMREVEKIDHKVVEVERPIEIVCQHCTYINYGRDKCQMCDNSLIMFM